MLKPDAKRSAPMEGVDMEMMKTREWKDGYDPVTMQDRVPWVSACIMASCAGADRVDGGWALRRPSRSHYPNGIARQAAATPRLSLVQQTKQWGDGPSAAGGNAIETIKVLSLDGKALFVDAAEVKPWAPRVFS